MDGIEKTSKLSSNVRQTEASAALIGHNLRGGEVIVLKGDLGSGKTAFVRGLTKGAGSSDFVSSPSFVIRNDYKSKKFIIAHFDFYRVDEPGILADSLQEVLNSKEYVSIVEWGDIVADIFPQDKMLIDFVTLSENKRQLNFTYPKSWIYLLD